MSDKRVDFDYDDAGQLDIITRYADLAGTVLIATSDYTFDPDLAGRLTGLTHANSGGTLASYSWIFDDAGRITQMTSPDDTSIFDYDDTNQLIDADHDYQSDEAYTYDKNGNRTNTGYVTGDNNRLLSDGTYNYEYDNEGNLITRTEIATGAVRHFEWDYRNRLIAVTDEDPSGTPIQRVEFTYDAFDRRISKSVDTDPEDGIDAPVTYFIYDGIDILLEFYDDDGVSGPNVAELTIHYFHGPATDQVLAQEDAAGDVEWLLADHLGTIRDIVDNTGVLLNRISYDSFGNITAQTNPTVETRYGFTGREYDAENGLHYYRARYYDATIGRFLSEDPLAFDAGDANLYRYTGNTGVYISDPFGKCASDTSDTWQPYEKTLKDSFFDFLTDYYLGWWTNWGGGHRGGGTWHFPPTLGDTTVPPRNQLDADFRIHDIERYVEENYPPGTTQTFDLGGGETYTYTSTGDVGACDDRVISKVWEDVKTGISSTWDSFIEILTYPIIFPLFWWLVWRGNQRKTSLLLLAGGLVGQLTLKAEPAGCYNGARGSALKK